jgi:hypothetical protein
MEAATTRTSNSRSAVLAIVVALLTSGLLTMPAQAENHGHDRGHQQMQRHHEDRGHGNYRLHSYGSPAYVYAPPPVYYAPPPGPPVIDFVFPLRFR